MTNFTVTDVIKNFSGRDHRLVERGDGFKFFLDEIFWEALSNHQDPGITEKLVALGVNPDEVDDVFVLLKKAGLIGGENQE